MAYRRLGGIVAEPWAAVRFDRLLVLEDHGQNQAKRARHARLVERVGHDVPAAPHRGVYLARSRGIVALTPADRFEDVTKDFADATGPLCGFTVCTATDGGYRVDLRTLDRVLDRIEASR